jgi:hypothetical protein
LLTRFTTLGPARREVARDGATYATYFALIAQGEPGPENPLTAFTTAAAARARMI